VQWGIYAILMTRKNSTARLRIGSGTEATYSVRGRASQYRRKDMNAMPRFVRSSFDRGFEIAHIGLLA